MKHIHKILLFIVVIFICCGQAKNKPGTHLSFVAQSSGRTTLINETGSLLLKRFNPPPGFERKPVDINSFGYYLRNLPLKPPGTKVRYYDGGIKDFMVYDAVVDMDIGNQNLQQCADAVMRLRGEYFYSRAEYNKIVFNFTNGFRVEYSEWIKGNRMVVQGNKTFWRKSVEPSNTYKDFRNYMNLIFNYAGTLSLAKSLKSKNIKEIETGDVFIQGGSPGHAVIVVDAAENKKGEKVFLLAQSYMPAQEIQILKNLANLELSPWYSSNIADELKTPEWTFSIHHLKTW